MERGLVRTAITACLATVLAMIAGCHRGNANLSPGATKEAQAKAPVKQVPSPNEKQADSKGSSYMPPTAEEMAPMRPEYLAELTKIHEPPEMVRKPMQVRNAVSPSVLKIENV